MGGGWLVFDLIQFFINLAMACFEGDAYMGSSVYTPTDSSPAAARANRWLKKANEPKL